MMNSLYDPVEQVRVRLDALSIVDVSPPNKKRKHDIVESEDDTRHNTIPSIHNTLPSIHDNLAFVRVLHERYRKRCRPLSIALKSTPLV